MPPVVDQLVTWLLNFDFEMQPVDNWSYFQLMIPLVVAIASFQKEFSSGHAFVICLSFQACSSDQIDLFFQKKIRFYLFWNLVEVEFIQIKGLKAEFIAPKFTDHPVHSSAF